MTNNAVKLASLILLGVLLSATVVSAEDMIEFTNGAKLRGKILDRNATSITIGTKVGETVYPRKYTLDKIAAVTMDGRREVLGKGPSTPSGSQQRTPKEIRATIEESGRKTPDWWKSVPLNYPRSLDLSWPQPPPGGWNSQRNVGQYYWDIINPNPSKWKSGIRLAHHLLVVNKSNSQTQQRIMTHLGTMYYNLMQDYPRAAFWWQHAGIDKSSQASGAGVHLAECYWKLGSKQMALDLIDQMSPHFATIKLMADMGETNRALRLADANLQGGYADIACIYAGDACRMAGQYEKAMEYYQKILRMQASGRAGKRIHRNQQRARANIEGIRLYEMLDVGRVPNGTYEANSLGYVGPVHVAVTVRGGRIESVRVTRHQEKQFYSAINDTTRKIVAKQHVKGVDATSGATMTSEAIINATAKALAGAMRKR